MSAQGIAKYENNPSSEPEFFNGLAIAAALGVSPYYLAGEADPQPDAATPSGTDDLKVDFGDSKLAGAFKKLGMKDRNQRMALIALIASQLVPFVQEQARQRKALQALLSEPSLDKTIQKTALKLLEPPKSHRS